METIATIKQTLASISSLDDPYVQALKEDNRKGVQKLLQQLEHRLKKEAEKRIHFEERLCYEKRYRQNGYQFIAGVDEVGRGPLAGPVVAAAVVLPEDFEELEVDDSKKLSKVKRELLFQRIQKQALGIGIGICQSEEIDQLNIYQATKKAMLEAISKLPYCDALLLDAMELATPLPQEKIIHGDARSISIAAASIIAKVTRDRLMEDYAKQYPYYDFEHNMGYGTKKHLEGIEKYGITPIHRKTFEPIKSM